MLGADEIHIWHIELDAYKDGKTLVDQRHLVNERHAILKQLLAYYVDQAPSAIELSYGEHGKPYLHDSRLEFNLAHSQHHLLCALAWNNPLGIDIEVKRPVHNWEYIAQKIFTPAEYEWLESVPSHQRMDIFFQGWTRKEAYLKMIGEGLFGEAMAIELLRENLTNCTLLDLEFEVGAACLVSRKKANSIRLFVNGDLSLL